MMARHGSAWDGGPGVCGGARPPGRALAASCGESPGGGSRRPRRKDLRYKWDGDGGLRIDARRPGGPSCAQEVRMSDQAPGAGLGQA